MNRSAELQFDVVRRAPNAPIWKSALGARSSWSQCASSRFIGNYYLRKAFILVKFFRQQKINPPTSTNNSQMRGPPPWRRRQGALKQSGNRSADSVVRANGI